MDIDYSVLLSEIKSKRYCAIDLETTGLSWLTDDVIGISLAWGESSIYIDRAYFTDGFKRFIVDVMLSNDIKKIFHNAKFDLHFIKSVFDVYPSSLVHDTMIMSQLINERTSHELKKLIKYYCGIQPDESIALKDYMKSHKLKSFENIPYEILEPYAKKDAEYTLKLFNHFKEEISSELYDLYALELRTLIVLLHMERRGVKIDRQFLLTELDRHNELLVDTLSKIHSIKVVNPLSSKQLSNYLFDELKLTPLKYSEKTNKPSCDDEVLESFDLEITNLLLDYRKLSKITSTYISPYLKNADSNDRLHCSFRQIGARTGRLSCTNPNLQNIPKYGDIRKNTNAQRVNFSSIVYKGLTTDSSITFIDYSQIEMRLFASLANEPTMINMFNSGIDVYAYTAARMFGVGIDDISKLQRDFGKWVNLGTIYGLGRKGLSNILSISQDQAGEILSEYYQKFPTVKKYIKQISRDAEQNKCVYTLLGRRCHLFENESYKAVNSVIQGSAADLLKVALVKLDNYLSSINAYLINTIHDEIWIENLEPKYVNDVIALITSYPLSVPLQVQSEYTITNCCDRLSIK